MVAGTFVNPGNAPLAEIEQAFANRPFALWSYRWFERIWARISGAGAEPGGAAHRNADDFRQEFESICAAVSRSPYGPR